METQLIFIHGFLGTSRDWDAVLQHLPKSFQTHTVDLEKDFELRDLNFKAWPEAFQRWLQKKSISGSFGLVGYSLGGRLIFPLVEQGICQRAVFLTPHPGLDDSESSYRIPREESDKVWADKFLNSSWEKVIQEWNSQDVFKTSPSIVTRLETDHDRQKLSALLTGFSLAKQRSYANLFEKKGFRSLYLAGEKDMKYAELANRLARTYPQLNVRLIKDSGHRLLLDQPLSVAREITHFFQTSN